MFCISIVTTFLKSLTEVVCEELIGCSSLKLKQQIVTARS